ncbi:MAG: hypothetical protein MRY57_04090 [Candidatus Pacebacteria bacterium]|nr:hypothetical protein [Candidatus Paceibacterota bacterium]
MNTPQTFSYLGAEKRERDYMTELTILGQTIIPSDTFWLGDNEYVVLDIPKKAEHIYIKILGIKGEATGSIYLIPKDSFEQLSRLDLNQFRQY